MNFEKDLSAQILYANENIKTTELNSLIYFLNGLTDEEFDRIFSGSQDDSINLNFNELVNIYYDVEPPRERKNIQGKIKMLLNIIVLNLLQNKLNISKKLLMNSSITSRMIMV